jgi:iron complex transport system ATP-binding protein
MTNPVDPPRLAGQSITVSAGGTRLIGELDIDIEPGTVMAIIGPNGAGKSTLLRALGRLMPLASGRVLLDGADIHKMRPREVGRALGILSQASETPTGFTVRQLIEQGRYPHAGLLGMLRQSDDDAIERALADTTLEHLASRTVASLSGGERQRAWLALALVQEPEILLLDEPTTFLDIAHQLETLELIAELNRSRCMTIAMVLHDLNQAARFADRIMVMDQGRIVADGTPVSIVSSELIAEVFRVDATVRLDPVSGRPTATFHSSLGAVGR